ncbi:MAG TPA: DUF4250 domain-containing protein [Clostridium perfringens]|nr:DUF4250 domain-containing protein [Clostridium perfringens]
MLRIDFDKLEIIEQIEYINNKLIEGNTLTNICKDLGIGRSTIRDRFKKVSYEYNKAINQYESIVEIVEAETVAPNEPIKEEIKLVIQQSSNKVVGTDNEILTSLINNYDDMNNKLNEMYNWYKLQSSNKVVQTEKFKVDDFEGDIVVRSYKLYEPIQREFLEFCKKNNKYKVQDILSQALKEFLDKYK